MAEAAVPAIIVLMTRRRVSLGVGSTLSSANNVARGLPPMTPGKEIFALFQPFCKGGALVRRAPFWGRTSIWDWELAVWSESPLIYFHSGAR